MPKMRVGLVVYGLDRPLTGIGRYILELATVLQTLSDQIELVLLTAGEPGPLAITSASRRQPLVGCRLLPGLLSLGSFLIPRAVRRLDLDLVHDPIGVTPFRLGTGRARSIVTVHDVFPWSFPGASSLLDTLIYRYWLPRLLPGVDSIITVSAQSRRDIERYLAIPERRIQIIPYGVSSRFRPLPVEDISERLSDRFALSDPYILYVGALTLRKNIESVLYAFGSLVSDYPDLRLVLAGPSSWKKTPVEALMAELGMVERVILTGPLTDADLPALYGGAELFVFPSFYEGFGLPPLEAMACGTPVVTSNASSLPEVVGDAALTVDPYDVEALTAAMRCLLDDAAMRAEMRARGLARARAFTWPRTARQTLDLYRQVLS